MDLFVDDDEWNSLHTRLLFSVLGDGRSRLLLRCSKWVSRAVTPSGWLWGCGGGGGDWEEGHVVDGIGIVVGCDGVKC